MSQSTGNTTHPEENGTYKWLALLAIVLGTFVAVLNNSLINVALPKLMAIFGSSPQDIQWVLTGYILASAVVIPISGYLGDKFGYKKVFILSLVFFTFSSLLSGLAWSDTSLIAFRIIQGLSGGFILPVGMAIIYMIMPREKIGMALGLWGIAALVAPAVGPTLSGYLIEYFSWRLLFFIIIPVGIFAVVMASILLKETEKKENLTLDKSGAVLSIIMFGSLLLALSKGQSEGWTSLYIVSLFFVAFFSFLLLIWVETGKDQPLLDLRLFKDPVFTISLITSGPVNIGLFGGIYLTPLFLQNIQGLSAVQTGLLLMPQSIAMGLMTPISGRLYDKFGVAFLGLTGLTILGITTFELHRLTIDTPYTWLNMILTIRGIGLGMTLMPLTTVGLSRISKAMIGQASSLSNVIRQVLGAFGIAILTTIMTQRQVLYNARISENVTVTSDAATQALNTLSTGIGQYGVDIGTAKGAASIFVAGLIQKEAVVRAIADTFLISAIPFFVALPFILFFVKKKKASEPAPTKS